MNIIDDILRREGSAYTDRPFDRGGPTKYGITLAAWMDYRTPGMVAHVSALTEDQAREFYRVEHVGPFKWITDATLRELVIDSSVNHGKARAVRWLQSCAGVLADGKIGPDTRVAVNGYGGGLYAEYLCIRLRFYAQIVVNDATQIVNLRGWINRACEFVR